jgi:hypothetical protein
MKVSEFSRYALCVGIAVAMLAGCGGSQPPIGAPGAMPQSAIATHANRGGSWMLPEAKSEDLLYASSLGAYVYVLSFPQGKLVGKLAGFSGSLSNECVDSSGDVFIPNSTGSGSEILEYAHGDNTPIATLDDTGTGVALACSIDPTTGNLAVANSSDEILVYPNAEGQPTTYTDDNIQYFWSCTYDSSGNLFADGSAYSYGSPIVELPNGGQDFESISVNASLGGPADIQWDGQYLDLQSRDHPHRSKHPDYYESEVLRVEVSGSSGTVVGEETLGSEAGSSFPQFWVGDGLIVQPINEQNGGPIGLWDYPSGGKAGTIHVHSKPWFWGVVVSKAQAATRGHR